MDWSEVSTVIQEHRLAIFAGLGATYAGIIALKWRGLRQRQATPDSYGHAAFGTIAQAHAAGLTSGPGIVVGRLGDTYLRIGPGRHVIMVGPTRSGKTTTAISTLLDDEPRSVIACSPKSSLRRHTAQARRGPIGDWPVYTLILADPSSPDRLNPFDLIRWRTIYEVRDAVRMARRLTTKDEIDVHTDASTYYRSGAESVHVFGLLCTGHDPDAHCSPAGLRRWLLRVIADQKRFRPWLEGFRSHPHAVIAEGATYLLAQPVLELPKWWAAAITWLDPWLDPILAHNTDTTTIPLADLQTGDLPMTVYIEAAAEDLKGPIGRVIKLDLEQLRTLTHEDTRVRRHRSLLVFDDMAEFEHFPLIQHSANLDAEYGWQLLLLIQSFNQLWEVLGSHASLLDNCSAWLVFTPNHPESARLISEKLGTTTVIEQQRRVTRGGFGRLQVSEGPQSHARDLMTTREVQELGSHRALLFVTDQPPFALEQVRWYAHPYWQARVPAAVRTAPRL